MDRSRHSVLTGMLAAGSMIAALFWLERRYPLRQVKPEPDKDRLPRNFAMAALTAVTVNLCERPLVEPLTKWVDRRQAGLLPSLRLPPKIETVLGIILLDYSLYWWHILLHRMPSLWRSHVVHHADLVLDASTALRFHWMEFIASVPWRLGQVAIFGIRPSTLTLWQRLTLAEVFFHHSNLRLPLPLEMYLSRFVMTPRLHGIHHSVVPKETNTNFSSGLTVWDVMHGTLRRDVPQERIETGVCDYRSPRQLRLTRLLILPFHPGY